MVSWLSDEGHHKKMNMILKVETAKRTLQTALLTVLIGGCASTVPVPHQPSEGHISTSEVVPGSSTGTDNKIPEIVQKKAFLPPPVPQPSEQDLERYTVVVNDVPVKELLFALARDASLNIDINSDIEGYVTLNAVEQTLPQILERISRQAGLRYELKNNNLYISPDDPYFRTYKIDYVNIERNSKGSISIATQVATTGTVDVSTTGGGSSSSSGSGNNDSTTTVSSSSKHHFWQTLTGNIMGLLGEGTNNSIGGSSHSVIVNPESGVLSVRATSVQHLAIQEFIDQVMINVQRQVLIEATIVEVTLSDRFQSGVDWKGVIGGDILTLEQNLISGAFDEGGRFFTGSLTDNINNPDITATLTLLKSFGDVKVLSSPKLMALNNQTAVLKVVENFVYFTIDSQISQATSVNATNISSIESEIHTVPVGLVMSVTPQINENSAVTMNVRPTISRISSFVDDPGPRLIAQQANGNANDNVFQNRIPVISVREMESILKVNSGQVAVLGGLMQDNYQRDTQGIPGLGDIPEVGNAFKHRDFKNTKSELIIFLRPIVMHNASLSGDLAPYRKYLYNNVTTPLPVPK